MEPCGIGCNFTELDSMAIPIQNGENNPMHSRLGIDDKGEFWPRLSSPGLTGRSSTPRRCGWSREASAYWMPRFRGA